MKVKTTDVVLNAFSIDGYNLPTFQHAKMKTFKLGMFKTVKYLHFQHYVCDDATQLEREYIRIK